MDEDPRCCGSGTCIIDPEGRCWCGQQWDGSKMVHTRMLMATPTEPEPNLPGDQDHAAEP